jgi:eukaryotic-like serine/threonine-protein kinase
MACNLLWDSANTQSILTYEEHKTRVSSIAWSRDGKYIASAEDAQVRFWKATTGQTHTFYREPIGHIQSLVWSHVDNYIVIGTLEGAVTVLALSEQSSTLVSQIRYRGHTAGVQQVAWSPDGASIAIAWSPDGSRIASAAHSYARVWQAL